MANIDKSDENKKLKRQLRQAQSKIDKMSSEIKDLKTKNKILSAESKKKQRKLILSSLTEKEREIVDLLPNPSIKRLNLLKKVS